ncbi:MAG TPA: DHA2 family efflux MFS transporter permease subunit [Gammaproteobacteria bacterium]|nr:DHA2 family efflux MFS transporter permease subunit [Gammaproteobacteria bacterium]
MPQMTNTHRWLITIAVMLVTVMEVLDLTIVNVALPYMKGSLIATNDQITWVLTSYVVSSGIMMPLTGLLINRLGVKRLILINIVGFLFSSMLCGAAVSLQMMVFCRILQGIFGASLVPISQFVLRNIFPPNEITKAMAIWGMGIMAGPVLGPTIGGYITDALNWRWIFYVNIPFCILAFFMCLKLIEETEIKLVKIDWLGMLLMATSIGCLQIFLDRGNTADWFNASSMRWLFIIFTASFVFFIIRGISLKEKNIINLQLFLNRNFSVGCLMLALFVASMFSLLTLQPILMESFMNYSAKTAGLVMAPRGIAAAFAMAATPFLAKHMDLRKIIMLGLLFAAFGTYQMTKVNLTMAPITLIEIGILQGIGMGFVFIPISNLTLATLPRSDYGEASGIFNFGRSLGISIGVSAMATLLTRNSQVNWNRLGGHLSLFSPGLKLWLAHNHLNLYDKFTLLQLSKQLSSQAYMISFLDDFLLASIALILIIPLTFLLEKPRSAKIEIGH